MKVNVFLRSKFPYCFVLFVYVNMVIATLHLCPFALYSVGKSALPSVQGVRPTLFLYSKFCLTLALYLHPLIHTLCTYYYKAFCHHCECER